MRKIEEKNQLEDKGRIEVKYKNTISDFKLATKLTLKFNKRRFIKNYLMNKILSVIVIILLMVTIYQIIKKPSALSGNIIYIIILIIVLVLLNNRVNLEFLKKSVQKRFESQICEKTCAIRNKKIVVKTKNDKLEIVPGSVKRIIEKKEKIFIFGDGYSLYAVVPFDAFKDMNQKSEFLNIVKGFKS